jgi:hypothetical protein
MDAALLPASALPIAGQIANRGSYLTDIGSPIC